MKTAPLVYFVDDDASIRKSVARLLRIAAYQVETYASADEFLETCQMAEHGCIVLDLRMPGLLSGYWSQIRAMKGLLPARSERRSREDASNESAGIVCRLRLF